MWEVFEYLISTSLSARSMMEKDYMIGGTVCWTVWEASSVWNSFRNICLFLIPDRVTKHK